MKIFFNRKLLLWLIVLATNSATAREICETNAKMATDSAHAAIVTKSCAVWMWGINNAGQLAEKPKSYTEPEKLLRPKSVPLMIDIVVAHDHTLGISEDRYAYIWGSKEYLSCGGDFFEFHTEPQRVLSIQNVKSISASWRLTVFLKQDGSVYEHGCTNQSNHKIEKLPVQVAGLPRIESVAIGNSHRLALSETGEVWSWGDWNVFGQLGTGSKEPQIQPVKVAGLPKIVTISAGAMHSMALDTDGNILVWGSNRDWQLGLGGDYSLSPERISGIPKVRAIATGWFSSAAITTKNRIFVWGNRSTRGYPTPAEVAGISDVASVYIGGNAAATSGIYIVMQNGNVFNWLPDGRAHENQPVPYANGKLTPFPPDWPAPFNIEMPNKMLNPDAQK